MIKSFKILALVAFGLFLAVFFLPKKNSLSPTPPTSQTPQTSPTTPIFPYETQTSEVGNVTVSVKPLALVFDQPPQFEITFDTHSVDLNFAVEKNAVLTDDQETNYGVASWNGSAPGGHHRSGTLTFFSPLNPKTKSITLTLKNIANISQRTFTWQL